MNVSLYRAYDHDGGLLYVGVSKNVANRFCQHHASEWIGLVRKVSLTLFASRESALGAERRAIKSEKPRFNIFHTEKSPKRSLQKPPTQEEIDRLSLGALKLRAWMAGWRPEMCEGDDWWRMDFLLIRTEWAIENNIDIDEFGHAIV